MCVCVCVCAGCVFLSAAEVRWCLGKDVVAALKAKHAANGYKKLVFYIEACESGSIFDGTLPADINVYATTAANPSESSWGCYCPGMQPSPPAGYNTCLGDLYSVAWMENTDASDRATETWQAQYESVKQRVSQNGTFRQGSHVMQYGDTSVIPKDDIDTVGPVGCGCYYIHAGKNSKSFAGSR